MGFKEYVILVILIFLCIEIILLTVYSINKFNDLFKLYIDMKNKEIKNKKNEMMMKIDPDVAQKYLDAYFEEYINKYIVYNFISKDIDYIKSNDIELMVKSVTKSIFIDISELYVFYIKINTNIGDDDELLKYIHTKVKHMVANAASSFNSSM